MKVKICGITLLDDAYMAIEAGADMLGLNFYEPSPRYLVPDRAAEISTALRAKYGEKCPLLVGVFVNASVEMIDSIMEQAQLDYAQLSGDESPEVLAGLSGRAFKAIRPADQEQAARQIVDFANVDTDDRAPAVLLDAYHPALYGGTGEQASADLVAFAKQRVPRLMLAGGLTPENIAERVRMLRPWGVDVASGVEAGKAGVKSAERVRAFIQAARSV
jgi:phosphoribosylanthranilate isomerase